eukprot:3728329-Pleurochrysis_carterae.AAC.1
MKTFIDGRHTSSASVHVRATLGRAVTMATSSRLREGDIVSMPVSTFGQQYARSRGAVPWTSPKVRDEGRIVGKRNGKWVEKFEGLEEPAVLLRKVIGFVSRPSPSESGAAPAGTTRRDAIDEENDDEDAAGAAEVEDSSSDPGSEDDAVAQHVVCQAAHEAGTVDGTGVGDWVRADEHYVCKRARHGFRGEDGPRLSGLADWEHASLLFLAKHFLLLELLVDMATEMTRAGAEKHVKGISGCASWQVVGSRRYPAVDWSLDVHACVAAVGGQREVLGRAAGRFWPASPLS